MALTSDVTEGTLLRSLHVASQVDLIGHDDASTFAASRRRVVFVNRFFYPDLSATSQILFDLAKRLSASGIEVHVICSAQLYDKPHVRLSSYECIYGIHVHRTWTSRFGRDRLFGRTVDYASFYMSSAAKLVAQLRPGDLVVAKTDPPLISIAAAVIARLRGAELINWLQDVFPEIASHLGANPLPGWLDSALKQVRDRTLSTACMNVVLGTRMREHLESRRVPADRIQIIENWADDVSVRPMSTEASELRARLGIQDRFVVSYSGNLGRAHEYETLLAAATELQQDQDVVFLMIGGGARMNELRAAVERDRLPNFRFLPYQPREALSDSLSAADVHLACLLPQLEGLIVPSKVYGILAAGRPVLFIGDDDGEIARIVTAARCGVAVRSGDSQLLAEVIRSLRRNPRSRAEMGLRARQLFEQKYTVKRATEQWLRVIANVL